MSCWLRQVFEDNDRASFAFVFTGIIVLALLTWDTYIVFTKGIVPNLADQSLFAVVIYASKKAATTVTSVMNGK
jgi:hypothetical protein